MKLRFLLLLIISFVFTNLETKAQGSPDYNGGIKVKLDDDGSKYIRFISWVQGQGIYNFDAPSEQSSTSFKVRRARLLAFSQINKDFLVLVHFGMNNLTSSTMSPVGKGEGSQIFLHDAWAQYNVHKNHSVGIGLHYFNGISRLNNSSTLNMLTLDINRQSWATIGLSDQFARHLGVFAKGNFGKLQYRVAVNDAIVNGLDSRSASDLANANESIYGGKRLLGSKDAGFAYAGYFEYNILESESNFLPFKVGSYLGAKKIFNVGAGFFYHPNGSVQVDNNDIGNETYIGNDVALFAADVFYEAPLFSDKDAVTAYLTYQSNDYGNNYMYSAYGTGSMTYGHFAYLLPGEVRDIRIQPYSSFGYNTYDAVEATRNKFGIGTNIYFSGHNSKLTLEYMNETFGTATNQSITLQAMIFI